MKSSITHATNENQTPASPESTPELSIIAMVLQIDDGKSYYRVRYRSLDGTTKTKLIPRDLFRTPTKVADILVGSDANLQDPVASVKAALLSASSAPYQEMTRRTGWHGHQDFVYPSETFGSRSGRLIYDGSENIDPALGVQSGSLAAWARGLRDAFRFSDYALFTASIAAGSCLLDIIQQDEGAVFHFHGTEAGKHSRAIKTKSSSGKTLVTRIGISAVGRCRKTDLATFAITPRAVEDFCSSHNHLVAALDEEGRAPDAGPGSTKATANLAYVIPSGRGKVRSNKATQDRNLANLSWAVLAISNGENPLDSRSLPTSRPEGAQTRMICIPVPAGRNGGVFNRVSGNPTKIAAKCKQLAKQVEDVISHNYGVAMPEYLRKLIRERPTLSHRVREIIDGFIERVGADTDPWERRFAAKFGIVLAGAILMSEFDIGPWTTKRAHAAVARLYKKARRAIVHVADVTDAVVKRLRKLVAAGKRFPVVRKGESYDEAISWGLVRKMRDGRHAVLIQSPRFEKLVSPRAAAKLVLSELEKRGILIKGADGKQTRQMMVSGSQMRHRYVCLSQEVLVSD